MADNKSPIAKAYVQVLPSTQGIKGALSGVFGGEGSSAGSLFGGNLVGTVKGIIAAAGIGELLKESLLAGADLQQSLGGVETLFKDSADIVIANAEQAYQTAGMSANEYMETVTGFSASLLQGLSGDTQAAAEVADMALTDMADNANKMGTSMELIQNAYQGFAKSNYSMLDNLKIGYGGTKTEMERLLAEAQKLTGVEYDIGNLADVYKAIHVIQEEMHISGLTAEEAAEMVAAGLMTEEEAFEALGTTAKEAATTFSGSFASMKAATGNLMAQLALGNDDLEPYLEALTETVFTFAGNLIPMVGNILSGLPAVIGTALTGAIRGLNLAARNADEILAEAVDLVVGLGTGIIQSAPYLAEAAWNLAVSLGSALIHYDWAGTMQQTVAELQNDLDAAAGEILETDGSIVDAVLAAIAAGLPSILEGGVSIVAEIANGLLAGLPGFLDTAGGLMAQLLEVALDAVPELFSAGVQLVAELAKGLLINGPAVFASIGSVLGEMIAAIVNHLPQLLEQGSALVWSLISGAVACIPAILEAAGSLIVSFIDVFSDVDWAQLGDDIIDGMYNGIISGVGAIIDAAKEVAGSALTAVKDFLGIASPSKVMRDEVGKFIPSGVAVGIDENAEIVTDSVNHLAELTVGSLRADVHTQVQNTHLLHDALYLDAWQVPTSPMEMAAPQIKIELHIHASEGMDEDALIEKAMLRMQIEMEKQGVKFA